jgi:uncharacterized membrane protein
MDDVRLASLEAALRDMRREIVELRAELRELEARTGGSTAHRASPPRSASPSAETSSPDSPGIAASAASASRSPTAQGLARDPIQPATRPPLARDRPAHRHAAVDFEMLAGRYGAMALATVLIVSALGVFLDWAISHNYIGPTMRVVLGLVAAIGVGAIGMRLRARDNRRFGSALLGLALAMVQADAWGAGPLLHVVPDAVALAVAAMASGVVAFVAWSSEEEILCAIGAGGALLAPFVTSSERGNAIVLLLYGWVVITMSLFAAKDRDWKTIRAELVLGCAIYAIVGMNLLVPASITLRQEAPAIFALACAWSALLIDSDATRSIMARALVAIAVIPLLHAASFGQDIQALSTPQVIIAAAGTLTVYIALALPGARQIWWMVSALVSPAALLGVAQVTLEPGEPWQRGLVAVIWCVMAALMAWKSPADRRGPHALIATSASAFAVGLALADHRVAMTAALAAHAAVVAAQFPRTREKWLVAPVCLTLYAATVLAFPLLQERLAYAYTPFVTAQSAAAFALAVAACVFSYATTRAAWVTRRPPPPPLRPVILAVGPVVTFAWVHEELAHAYSPDLATVLLILYFAATGVATIGLGRVRAEVMLRRIGLALAIYGALKAVVQAYSVSSMGLRVGVFLFAGLFLLAVAYWYRATGDRPVPGAAA